MSCLPRAPAVPSAGRCLPRVKGHCPVLSPTSGPGQANPFLWPRVRVTQVLHKVLAIMKALSKYIYFYF